MPATPSVDVSQSFVTSVTDGGSPEIQTSMAFTNVVGSFPTERFDVAQASVTAVTDGPDTALEVSQSFVIVVAKGKVDDPTVRAWTFTLDGHDFYVLRLGNTETLVYDLTTEQWFTWGSGDSTLWDAYTGTNWIGGNTFSANFGSNVIVGSNANGSLFFLDPDKPNDDPAVEGRDLSPFRRRITAQLPVRGYNRVSVYQVEMLGSVSELDTGATDSFELLYSDDRGSNYTSAGSITSIDEDFSIRASWRSLGSFSSPGRIFRVQDTGSLKRIDSLTVSTNFDQG